MHRYPARLLLVAASLAIASPALAEVKDAGDGGLVIRLTQDVSATPQETWKALLSPGEWWSGEHTYSGDAKNLYIDAQATGCFCEKLPRPKDAPEDQRIGSVEHMHVVYAQPNRALRMTGGLGPLQSEAVQATMTMTLKPTAGGTHIVWEYVVGGYMRYKRETIGPMVDKVLGEQITRLGAKLGAAAKAPDAEAAAKAEASAATHPASGDAGTISVGSDVAADFDASVKTSVKPKPKPQAKPAVKKQQ